MRALDVPAAVEVRDLVKTFPAPGGQAQRFSIVAALVNDPEVVFLDLTGHALRE